MLWNNSTDAGKETARKQKRKLTYVSNIYVVKDPANPRMRAKSSSTSMVRRSLTNSLLLCNLSLKMRKQSIRLISGLEIANFKLKAKNVAGYRNYDSSEFARPDALLDDDEAMESAWKKEYSLAELVAADQFKTYDELKLRLDYVLGNKGTSSPA